MRKIQAAAAAVLAGGALFGLQAVLGSPDRGSIASQAPEADTAAAASSRPAAALAPSPAAISPDPEAPAARLADAEAERDRLAAALAAAAAERDALAERLAAEEAARAGTDGLAAEVERLTGALASQAAAIDRLKSDLAARDVELAALRDAAKILPAPDGLATVALASGLPYATLGRAPDPRPARPVAARGGGPLAEVLFERGSARLTEGAAERAAEAAAAIDAIVAARIRLAGHSDTTGSAEANLRLSLDRAEAVAAALVAAGVARERIDIEAHGQAPGLLPVATGPGISEPLNRSVGIYPVTLEAARPLIIADEAF